MTGVVSGHQKHSLIRIALFLEGSGEGAAHRVRLPAGDLADLAGRRALWTLQHPDRLGLFAVRPGARLGPGGLGRRNRSLQFWIARLDGRPLQRWR